MSNIDYETLMNDKKLLQEQVKLLQNELQEYKDAYKFVEDQLYEVLRQRSDLTDEVMRLSTIIERGSDYDNDWK